MVGWHHWLSGYEFRWTPGVGDGQGGLACLGSQSWTGLSDWNELSRGSPQPRDQTLVFYFFCIVGRFFTHWITWEAINCWVLEYQTTLALLKYVISFNLHDNPGTFHFTDDNVTHEVGNGNPLQYSCLENHGQKSLQDYNPWGCKESETTEWLNWTELKDSTQNLLSKFSKLAGYKNQ